MSIRELLTSIGLTDKEIAIYLNIIRMQPSRAKDIALHSELTRPTTYDILNNLKEKNLIEEIEMKGIKYFHAKDPSALVQYIEGKAELFERYKKQAKNLLPELELLKHPEVERPEIHFLTPETALPDLYKLLKKSKNCKLFFDIKESNREVQRMLEKKEWKDIHFQILLPSSKENMEFKKNSKHNCKLLQNPTQYTSDTFLFDEYMAIITYEPIIQIIVIKNRNISETHSHIFNSLWKMN